MLTKFISFLFVVITAMTPLFSQNISPTTLIANSIKYHDPEGILLKKEISLFLSETRPNGPDRKTKLEFEVDKGEFEMERNIDGVIIKSEIEHGKVSIKVDGRSGYSETEKEKYKLSPERVETMKNYYQYLWLLPMKLNDVGTNFNPLIKEVDFFGKQSLELRVTYDQSVGIDIWYFYFNPETYALHGYRFYHDEEKNDGEYITLEGETVYKSVRLPKTRKWYTHKEGKFLGADILDEIKF